jgi:polysaccharide export outer membrane protein
MFFESDIAAPMSYDPRRRIASSAMLRKTTHGLELHMQMGFRTLLKRLHALARATAHLTMSLCLAVVTPAVHAAAPGADYELGSDDRLKIDTFDHPELSLDTRISKSGNISFPLLGAVHAGGLSTHQLEDLLSARLSEGGFVRRPQVSVLVTEYESQKVAVLGQVVKPGSYALTTSSRVLDMLSQAGGLVTSVPGGSPSGLSGDEATLIRRDGTKVPIDLHALMQGDFAQNPAVTGGDTLVVAAAPVFYVYGQVQKPGPYKLERDMTVMQAVATGGGLTVKGSERWMKIKRRQPDGTMQAQSVNGRDLLRPDDVLVVNEGWF